MALNFGLVGIICVSFINFYIWNITTKKCYNNRIIRLIFHLFQIGFLLMNYFRWPTECGISEIIIFAFVLKLIEQEFDKQPEYKRKRKRIEMVL